MMHEGLHATHRDAQPRTKSSNAEKSSWSMRHSSPGVVREPIFVKPTMSLWSTHT